MICWLAVIIDMSFILRWHSWQWHVAIIDSIISTTILFVFCLLIMNILRFHTPRQKNYLNIFGGTELDLSRADINGEAIIEMTTIFGGTKLVVPSNWTVKSDAAVIFGGVEDKRAMPAVNEVTNKTLTLKGTVIFGGIDIKSY